MSMVDDEIAEQPARLSTLLARDGWPTLGEELRARSGEGYLTVARGSSDHAALFFAALAARHLGRTTASIPPSLATLYEARLRCADRVALAVSQSGASKDVVAALASLKRDGAWALAVTNDASSPLARAADRVVDLACGPERAIAATKTFTASVAAAVALVAHAANEASLLSELGRVGDAARAALDVDLGAAAKALASSDAPFILARGALHALALEGALKLKEVARLRAEGLSSAEFLHGPRASVTSATPVVLLVAGGPARASVLEVAASLEANGAGPIVLVGDAPARGIVVPAGVDLREEVAAVPIAIVLQRLAVAVARLRGVDPDRPPLLVKVTETW